MACNICGSDKFSAWRGRPDELCNDCGALARHRIAFAVYQHHLFTLEKQKNSLRVLHLAPEPCLQPALDEVIGPGYVCADASPERYPHAECLKLFFPEGFAIFPEGYFDAILHNHVLEHIPGHYGKHLIAFVRMLKPGGRMIFSVPGPYKTRLTEEGGEHFKTDAERLDKFLQKDHFKILGADFIEFLHQMPGGFLVPDGITNALRKELNVRPNKAPFFVWEKSR